MNIGNLFESVFAESVNAGLAKSNFEKGFNDGLDGKAVDSENKDYLFGYGLAYEYGEKRSALNASKNT